MRKKRFLLFVLIYLTCFSVNVFAQSESQNSYYEQAINTLVGLNIIEVDELEYFLADEPVTRGEFSSYAVKILGLGNAMGSSEGVKSSFDDVPEEHPYAATVELVSQLKIMDGYGNRFFGIDDLVTLNQAIKIFVCILGYDVEAKTKGGFPSGYYTVAQQKGLLKNVSLSDKKFVKQEMAIMLYNSLDTAMLLPESYGENIIYSKDRTKTILSEKMKIYKGTGQVTANAYTGLYKDSNLNTDEIEINDEIFVTDGNDLSHFLGYVLNYYYTSEDDDSAKRIIYAEIDKSKNETITIEADHISKYENYEYSYSLEDNTNYTKDKIARLSQNVDVIYNGKVISVYDDRIFMPNAGNVVLLDVDKDDYYDVAFITASTSYVVEYVADGVIYNKYNPLFNIDSNETDTQIRLVDINGNKISIYQLKEWDILTVTVATSLSGGNYFYNIIRSNNMVEGEATELIDSSNLLDTEIVVGGEIYGFSYDYPDIQNIRSLININASYLLDSYGKISAVILKQSSQQIAYLLAANHSGSGLNKQLQLKLYRDTGELSILDVADKAKIDNLIVKSENVIEALSIEGAINQLIVYKVNSEGKIDFIDTQKSGTGEIKDSLRMITNKTAKRKEFVFNSTSLSGKIIMNPASTKIFKIPLDLEDENSIGIDKTSIFSDQSAYTVDAYYLNDDSLETDYVVYRDAIGSEVNESLLVDYVTKIIHAVNPEGVNTYKLYLYQKGIINGYFVYEDNVLNGESISEGDGVRVKLNGNNEIIDLQKVFDVSEYKIYINNIAISNNYYYFEDKYYGKSTLVFGDVEFKKGNIVTVMLGDDTSVDTNMQHTGFKFDNNTKVYKYHANKNTNRIDLGTIYDIVDKAHSETMYSKVFMHLKFGQVLSVLIVNN